ncbi:MAG: mechanosensitive ion channel [Gemmatimonadetes bacterium]|nr:mechanosensitive ion channel [Gemmatimonadota bacterium]
MNRFRQSSMFAVAITGLLLLAFSPAEVGIGRSAAAVQTTDPTGSVPVRQDTDSTARESAAEAAGALRTMWSGFVGNLPKYLMALGILLAAWLLVRLLRTMLRRALGHWERADAIAALSGVAIWLLAAGIALSVVLGDIRALAGSLGLVGLALSWALQTPIESFTGWLLNSFKGYYRVGDRIAVGDVFGDVYRIDFLNTTVWEYGGPDRPPGWVQAEQPTGRMITFPNNEIVTGSVVNYTRDFPFIWDELTVPVAHESDLSYTMEVLARVGRAVVGEYMREPAREYQALLRREGLESSVADAPQVFASTSDWSANFTIRYLVGAREKRMWKSELVLRFGAELARPEHVGKIIPVYPRQQIQLVERDGISAGSEAMWGGRQPPHRNDAMGDEVV